ncbi:hypothetical protein [Bacteroides thetaiotaomicron]|uniref:hypothetical protein n=1 Tax=Bacteroides thetaiotaomicron TaxID=818 RepID=UPI0034A276E0
MEIVNRIRKIVDEKANGNKKEFSSIINIVQVTFNRYMNGRTPSYEVIDSILRAFPDISAEWLLRGEGEMKKKLDSYSETATIDNAQKLLIEFNKQTEQLLKDRDDTIRNLQLENAFLKAKENIQNAG